MKALRKGIKRGLSVGIVVAIIMGLLCSAPAMAATGVVVNDPFNSGGVIVSVIPWEEHFHTGFDDAFTTTRSNDATSDRHIQTDFDTVYFYGYDGGISWPSGDFSDYLYYTETDGSLKTFEFDMDFYMYTSGVNREDQEWHSLISVGYLVNCTKNSDGTISGFYFSMEPKYGLNQGGSDTILAVRLLDHVDFADLFNNSANSSYDAKIYDYTSIFSTDLFSFQHAYMIESSSKEFSVYQDGSVLFSINVDNPGPTPLPAGYTGGNDFGFLSSYAGSVLGHSCDQLSVAEFHNVTLSTASTGAIAVPEGSVNVHFVDISTRDDPSPVEIDAVYAETGFHGQSFSVYPPDSIGQLKYVEADSPLTGKYVGNEIIDIVLYYETVPEPIDTTPYTPPPNPGSNTHVAVGREPLPSTTAPRPDNTGPALETEKHIRYIFGYPDGSVRPDSSITRAEAVTIFYRLIEESDKNEPVTASFSDIASGDWYYQAVAYLEKYNMIVDSSSGVFRPNEAITRAEYAALAAQFDNLSTDVPNAFPDVPDDHWAVGYINSAAAKGWVEGFEDGTFKPDDTIKRDQLVTIVNRMLDRKILLEDIPARVPRYTDLTSAHWAYTDIIEASTEHDYTRKTGGFELWQ